MSVSHSEVRAAHIWSHAEPLFKASVRLPSCYAGGPLYARYTVYAMSNTRKSGDDPSWGDIDQQHAQLFTLFDEVKAYSELGNHDFALSSFERLLDGLREHFDFEERVMEGSGYPNRSGHKWEHHILLEETQDLLAAARLLPRISGEAVSSLRRIIHDHTNETDSDLSVYLRDTPRNPK
jgi:hemerythrin-like metal-binding protein